MSNTLLVRKSQQAPSQGSYQRKISLLSHVVSARFPVLVPASSPSPGDGTNSQIICQTCWCFLDGGATETGWITLALQGALAGDEVRLGTGSFYGNMDPFHCWSLDRCFLGEIFFSQSDSCGTNDSLKKVH